MKNLVVIFTIIFIAVVFVYGQDDLEYRKVYDKFSKLSDRELNDLGLFYFDRHCYDTSLMCFSIISGRYKSENSVIDKRIYVNALNKMGVIYWNHYNYSKALDFFINGLKICEQIDYNDYIPRFYNNIGNVYVSFKDYVDANKYFKKAYDLCKNDDGNELMASILMNMIGVSYFLNDYEQARKYINEYDKLNLSENPIFKHSNLISLGMLNMNIKRYDSALYYFKKSFEIKDICDFGVKYRCISCSNIANAYDKMFCYDSAVYYLNMNLSVADKHKLFDILSESFDLLSELYNKSGNKKMSQFYRGKYFDINDSLFNVKEYGKIKQIQYLYEMEKIDKQIQLLNAEKQNKDDKIKMQQSILGVGTFVLSVIILFFVVIYIQKRKLTQSYKDLFTRNMEIVNSEKFNRELRIDYDARLKERDIEILNLKQCTEELKTNCPETDYKIENEDTSIKIKYSTSTLNEDRKEFLLTLINDIMENTKEFYNPDFSLEKLALIVNSKSKYVSQVINETYGKNFSMFVNEQRVKEARKLLSDMDYSKNYTIESISEKVGFKSRANFNVIFKKITGITPSLYMEMVKKDKI